MWKETVRDAAQGRLPQNDIVKRNIFKKDKIRFAHSIPKKGLENEKNQFDITAEPNYAENDVNRKKN